MSSSNAPSHALATALTLAMPSTSADPPPTNVSRPALAAFGFQVHLGSADDGSLDGRWWWTLFKEGWGECETSPAQFDTDAEAWDDAEAAYLEGLVQ